LDAVQGGIVLADAKTAVAAALELGTLTATGALAGTRTAHTPLLWALVLAAALACQTGAILAAISALMPRIHQRPGQRPDLFYFGTLRTLSPEQFAKLLRTADLVGEIASQTVHTSAIAWRKHTRLRLSLRLAGAGLALCALAATALAAS
jgi:uncharacterized membrane protein YfcA